MMLTTTQTFDRVLIFSLSGELTAADVDAVYDALNSKLADNRPASVYLELLGDFSIEGGALLKDMQRAHEVLGKLKQFDRIAVVAEPSWLRAIVRIESAAFSLLDLNMQVYTPEERQHALAWAKEETDAEHPDSLKQIDIGEPDIVAFEIDGKFRKQDVQVAQDILESLDETQSKAMLVRMTKFAGFELAILIDSDFLAMKRDGFGKLKRYAVVGGPEWIGDGAEKLSGPLPFAIRAFDLDEESDAIAWLGSGS